MLAPGSDPAQASETGPDSGRVLVTAPIVGTFYQAPSPGAEPFVRAGDLVEPGQQVGIVEAMKLMNSVTADCAGQVSQVLAGDGEPVEFGQPLVAISVSAGTDALAAGRA
jgi:acetyl-CoA carboxylase biotin carboxyl carrier protein